MSGVADTAIPLLSGYGWLDRLTTHVLKLFKLYLYETGINCDHNVTAYLSNLVNFNPCPSHFLTFWEIHIHYFYFLPWELCEYSRAKWTACPVKWYRYSGHWYFYSYNETIAIYDKCLSINGRVAQFLRTLCYIESEYSTKLNLTRNEPSEYESKTATITTWDVRRSNHQSPLTEGTEISAYPDHPWSGFIFSLITSHGAKHFTFWITFSFKIQNPKFNIIKKAVSFYRIDGIILPDRWLNFFGHYALLNQNIQWCCTFCLSIG
jgi:hypothetical protein